MGRWMQVKYVSTFAFCLILLFAILLGIITNRSYVSNIQKAQNNPDVCVLITQFLYDEDVGDIITTSLESAEIIVKAKKIGNDWNEYQAVKCFLKVVEVYRGNISIDDEFYFYQTNYFDYNSNHEIAYFNHSFFNLMEQDHDYIIFANKREFHPEYEKTLKNNIYVPVNRLAS